MGADESKTISVTNTGLSTVIEFEWQLKKTLNLSSIDVGKYVDKSIVPSVSSKYSFSLCLYPHGFNERTKNYVSIWLRKGTADELSVRFTCSIADQRGAVLCSKKTQKTLALETVLGWPVFCSRYVIMDDQGGTTQKEDDLIVRGKIEVLESSSILNEEIEDDPVYASSLAEMSDNLDRLLTDGGGLYDFVIKADGQRLRAHKAVLSARSSVFRAMFQSNLHRNLTEVIVTDIGAEAMATLLRYVYTGRLDNLSVPIAMEVYYAADKYEVFILRNICSTVLSKNLLPENVIEVLLLAYRHSDAELQESCLRYMDKNLREIKGRPEWIGLMRNHPNLADKALFFALK